MLRLVTPARRKTVPAKRFRVRVPICDQCFELLKRDSYVEPEFRLPWYLRLIGWKPDPAVVQAREQRIRNAGQVSQAWNVVTNHLDEMVAKASAELKEEMRRAERDRISTKKGLRELGGQKFEVLVARLFARMGYETQRTRGTRDGGVDIHARQGTERITIQCKNYQHAVGPGAVRDLFGTMKHAEVDRGILVCTGEFTEGAREFAKGKPIELIDGETLVDLIKQHGLADEPLLPPRPGHR